MHSASSLTFWLWAPAVLVLARVLSMAWTAPAWGTPALGWRIRLALAAMLTLIVTPVVRSEITLPREGLAFGRMVLAEAAIGSALGLSMSLVIAGARQAGEVVGVQAGLSAASLFDPEAGSEMTPLGHLYGLIALGAFLALDGPLRLVGALIQSYRAVPPGQLSLSLETAEIFFGRLGQALSLALGAAAPAALALVLAGMAMGLLTRAAPTFQLISLALPVRSAVGLLLVLVGLATLVVTLSNAWRDWPLLNDLAGSAFR
jgi:flagellar biosynthesis protein FliR